MSIQEYFDSLSKKIDEYYVIAEKARRKNIDPVDKVEVPLAISLAEKTVGLISVIYPRLNDKKIVNRILELENIYGQLNICVSLSIAEEVSREKFCKFDNLLQAIDAGIRVGFSYFTLGVVSSPIEGFTGISLGKTKNNEDYLKAYFSGPIRSAGTTASCVVLMIIDYLRENFGFAKYDPTEEEVKRYVSENYDYHERITNLQYLPTEDEIIFLARNLPIQITGEPTEQREVSNYKDLSRIDTNFIRGGMCLIFSEGLAQKAAKGFRLLKGAKEKGFKSSGWDFLEEYISLHKKRDKKEGDNSPTYIKDIVAGRPVFGHPGKPGGFRFRYGRSRTNGFSATSIHPASMAITDSFISTGTQLKIEKPTKGCAVSVCDSIDGPIVKLRNGSVKKLDYYNEAMKIYPEVEEVIYLGDILVPLGDVINRNHELLKPGYVEEWWKLDFEENSKEQSNIDPFNISLEDAVRVSLEYKIPFHPKYIFYWNQIDYDLFLGLLDWLARGMVETKLILPYSRSERERFVKGKRALELLGCSHEVGLENVILSKEDGRALFLNLGLDWEKGVEESIDNLIKRIPKEGGVLDIINANSKFVIKDKAGDFIGSRMGRPEKAKLRKLTGSPHVLFPVGAEGGRLRSFQSACEIGSVKGDFPNFYCSKCGHEGIYPRCELCNRLCNKRLYCFKCDKHVDDKCHEHNLGSEFRERKIDIRTYFDNAKRISNVSSDHLPSALKGVRGTSNENHECENLAKGFLRAKYNLNVNKDGTIRYDMTEMPITHFKPSEIGVSIDKLKTLGYKKDFCGKEIISEDQLIEIYPHDIILPSCPFSNDEKTGEVFLNVSKFIDDELEHIYGLPRQFNYTKSSDLIGSLFACIAPHICTAVVGRLIGFSKTQTFLASPYMHAAMRRDCDGDEAAVMFLSDMLINFSRKFLPAHRGGTQDSPLVLNSRISPGEVDDQILDFDVGAYSLDFYRLAEKRKHSSEVNVETIKSRLKAGKDAFSNLGFTHTCSDINGGVLNSSYKSLPTMQEKVDSTMRLCKKIRAVEISDVARLIIERHFIRDIRGNLRKFSMQVFRCVNCNSKFRRPPLIGRCTNCSGKLIFTISEGSIVKYLASALDLARKYNVSSYLLECLELVERDIEGIFGKEKEKQENLGKWF